MNQIVKKINIKKYIITSTIHNLNFNILIKKLIILLLSIMTLGCIYIGDFDAATRDPFNLAGGKGRNDEELVERIQKYYFIDKKDIKKEKSEKLEKDLKTKKGDIEYEYFAVSRWLDKDFLSKYDSAPDEKAKRIIRNNMIDDLILLSDLLYEQYKHRLNWGKTLGNFVIDITSIALTGTATITGHTDTKDLLTGLSTIVQGAGLSINKNLYYEQTMATLINVMDTNRLKKKALLLKFKDKDIIEISLQRSLSVIFEYHHAGSAVNALATLEAYSIQEKDKQLKSLEQVLSTEKDELFDE